MREVELLKSSEVKDLLKISKTTLWLLVKDGVLKTYRVGKHTIRFKKNEVLDTIKPIYSNE